MQMQTVCLQKLQTYHNLHICVFANKLLHLQKNLNKTQKLSSLQFQTVWDS